MNAGIKKLLNFIGIRDRFKDGYDTGAMMLLHDDSDAKLLEWVDMSKAFNSFDEFDRGLLAARDEWLKSP